MLLMMKFSFPLLCPELLCPELKLSRSSHVFQTLKTLCSNVQTLPLNPSCQKEY